MRTGVEGYTVTLQGQPPRALPLPECQGHGEWLFCVTGQGVTPGAAESRV